MHKIVEKCRSGRGMGGTGGRVGIPYNSTFRYTGPWHTRIAITFVRFNIFTCGFLQRFKHRLDLILSFVLSQGIFLVLSQDATFSFVTGVVGVGALARARIGTPLQNSTFVHFAMLSMIIENTHNIDITTDKT